MASSLFRIQQIGSNMSRKTLFYVLSLSLLLLLAILLLRHRSFMTSHDDVSFPQQLAMFHSPLKYLAYRYTNWSGRLAIDLVLPYVLGANVWLWRILNAMAFPLLFAGIWLVTDAGKTVTSARTYWSFAFFLLFAFFLCNGDVLKWAIFWASGSMNYFWPATCLCLALIPFSRLLDGHSTGHVGWLLIIPPGCFACYLEQTALILVSFAAISVAVYSYQQRKIYAPGLFVTVFFTANLLVLLLAQGNTERFIHESVKYYPHFAEIPWTQKSILGANYTLFNHFFYESVKQFILLPTLTVFLVFSNNCRTKAKFFASFSLAYTSLCILFARGLKGNLPALLNLNIYGTITETTAHLPITLHVMPLIIGLAVLLMLPCAWLSLPCPRTTITKALLFYLAGLFSSFILSFSPTIFASGYRIFFVPDMMILITAFILLTIFLDHFQANNRYISILLIIISFFGGIKIVSLLT